MSDDFYETHDELIASAGAADTGGAQLHDATVAKQVL